MLPLREVTEVFPGTQIGWESEIKTAWLLYGFLYADIQYGATEMHMNSETVTLANPAEIRDGRDVYCTERYLSYLWNFRR